MLLKMARFHCFLWLSNIPLCIWGEGMKIEKWSGYIVPLDNEVIVTQGVAQTSSGEVGREKWPSHRITGTVMDFDNLKSATFITCHLTSHPTVHTSVPAVCSWNEELFHYWCTWVFIWVTTYIPVIHDCSDSLPLTMNMKKNPHS